MELRNTIPKYQNASTQCIELSKTHKPRVKLQEITKSNFFFLVGYTWIE